MKNRWFYNIALVALIAFASVAKAAVSFDQAADLGNNGGTTSSLSGTFTVNSGDTIVMVVAMGDSVPAAGGSGRDDTSVTDNGVAMTLAGKILNSQDCWEYLFYSLNPVTGSHTIVANATVAHWLKLGAASYKGVVGVGASTTHSGTGTSLTTSLTTQANSWIFIAEDAYSGGAAPTAGAGDVRRSYEGTYGTWGAFDSNAALSSGAHSFTTNVTQNVAITHIALELTTSSSSGSTITFDHGADLGNNGGTTSSLSGTFTVNSGDTILMVVAMGDAVPAAGGNGVDDTTVTDNAVGMSLAGKILNSQDCWEYLFYSLNPATGSHTIVAHAGSAHWLKLGAASYKGVVGIGASTTHSGTGTSLTTSLMTGHGNSWIFVAEDAYSGGGPGTAGTGDVRRSYEPAFGTWGIYDSNAALTTPGTYNVTTNRSSSVVITHIAVELTATSGGVSTPITFDHAVDLGNNGGSTSSLSGTFTVNSGDTILMVVAMGDGVPATGGNSVDDTTVTDNGVAMTLAGKILNSQDCWEYLFYSLSPATGSHTIVAKAGTAHWLKLGAASYTGVTGIGASTTHSGTGTSLTTSLMTGQPNSWVFLAEDAYSGGSPGTAGTGDVRRSYEAAFGTWGAYDSNAVLSTAGTYSFTTNRPSSVVITHIVAELMSVSTPPPPPPPPPSNVPPPPALTGTVWHISATAGDQTSTAQSVINSAASGDTVFWDEGNHSICGTLSLKSGVLFVGPSATFPLLGQNSRAVINGCGETGTFDNSSGATVYGLSLTSFGTWDLTSVNNLTITNLFWDQGNINSSHHTFCYTNASNVTIQWSTFQNFEGIGNLCTSGGMSNFIFTHNVLKNCRGDCIGVSDFNSSNEQYTFNHFTYDPQYTNCGASNCIGRIQMELQWDNNAYAGQPGRHGLKINNNFFEGLSLLGFNDAPNTCCNFSLSVVDGGFDQEIGNNYLGGSDAGIEWDAGPEWCKGSGTTCGVNLHDNYVDSVNTPGFVCGAVDPASGTASTVCGNFGPYETSLSSVVSNNNYLPAAAGSGCPNTGTTMPCDSVQYPTPDTHVNRGRPAVPASGSAP